MISPSLAVDSPVRTPAVPDVAPDSTVPGADSGLKWHGLLVKYVRRGSELKIALISEQEDSKKFCKGLPKWGMMLGGVLWEQTTPERLTDVSGSGYWRTPAASEPGVKAERLVPIEGGLPGGMNRHFDRYTGRMAQIGLLQQVQLRGMWPTPSARDWKDTPGMAREAVNPEGSMRRREDQQARRVYATQEPERWESDRGSEHGGTRGDVCGEERGSNDGLFSKPPKSDWWATEPVIRGMVDGLANRLDEFGTIEGEYLGRVAIGVPARTHRLKAIGNGQVPICTATAFKILHSRVEN